MDEVIRLVYSFERNSLGYQYVRACLKTRKIIHPRRFIQIYEPDAGTCVTSHHLVRAAALLEEHHPNFKFY